MTITSIHNITLERKSFFGNFNVLTCITESVAYRFIKAFILKVLTTLLYVLNKKNRSTPQKSTSIYTVTTKLLENNS